MMLSATFVRLTHMLSNRRQCANHEAVIQLVGGQSGVEIDFPIISEYQKSMQSAVRSFFESHGLEIRGTVVGGEHHFLDVPISPDVVKITFIIQQLLTSVFGVGPDAKLEFMGERLSHYN